MKKFRTTVRNFLNHLKKQVYHMSKRLEKIAAHILAESSLGFADVGTDHGYLPLGLLSRGYGGYIFASDLRPDPLSKAIAGAKEAGVYDRICFSLGDGLDNCPGERIDSIVIAGMGGDTICGILDRAEWCMDSRYTLILQPMSKAEVLRYWLTNNEFEITSEELIEENGEIYQLMKARFGQARPLKDSELFLGSLQLVREQELFRPRLERLIKRFERSVKGLALSRTRPNPGRLSLFENILGELKEIYSDEQHKRDI